MPMCAAAHPEHADVVCHTADTTPHSRHTGVRDGVRVQWANVEWEEKYGKQTVVTKKEMKELGDEIRKATGGAPQESEVPAPVPDASGARAAADAAIAEIDANTDEGWKEAARSMLVLLARTKPYFNADDFWFAGLPSTHDNRALGPILRWGAKEGYIYASGDLVPSEIATRHGRPTNVWYSKLYDHGVDPTPDSAPPDALLALD